MSEYWKPMHNAPKDGSPVFLKLKDGYSPYVFKHPCVWHNKGWATEKNLVPIVPTPVAWKREWRKYASN